MLKTQAGTIVAHVSLDARCLWEMIPSCHIEYWKNYDHRREWIEAQLLTLAGAFAIDVAAYSVMSNHLHLV